VANLVYKEGDLFDGLPDGPFVISKDDMPEHAVIIPHVCNDMGAWGAGFVVPLGRKYPDAQKGYKDWADGKPPKAAYYPAGLDFALGRVQMVYGADKPMVIVANMIAQERVGGARPLRYNALAYCMDAVAADCLEHHPKAEIRCPLFGAGLAGGQWPFIEALIEDCWLRQGFDVTVYYMRDRLPPGWTPPEQ
jgi:hypothetical protein